MSNPCLGQKNLTLFENIFSLFLNRTGGRFFSFFILSYCFHLFLEVTLFKRIFITAEALVLKPENLRVTTLLGNNTL